MHRVIAFDPSLVSEVGDHTSAVVLSQIGYWHRGRLRINRGGKMWLVKSRAEMCAETGITLDQYKRVMPLLTRRGLVVTERHLFKGKVTPFIRLTKRGLDITNRLGVKATNPLVSDDTNLDTSVHIVRTKKISSTSNGEQKPFASTGSTTLITYGGNEAKEVVQKQTEGDECSIEIPSVNPLDPEGWLMKATEVLRLHTGAARGSLSGYWQSRLTTVYGETFKPALTVKEKGQLKLLSKSLGDDTKPVIDYVINHWWKFANRASAIGGTSAPAEPHIGFLLKHHAVAMNLLKPPPAQPQEAVEPVQLIATGTGDAPAHKLTSQELADLLDGLKSP